MYILAGNFKGKRLVTPKGDHIRPTQSKVRASIFNSCQWEIENSIFLDVCAGAGTMGFEALSRGAKHVTFIENHPQSLEALSSNQSTLQVKNQSEILPQEALIGLNSLNKKQRAFDLIFVDPPYGSGLAQSILNLLDNSQLMHKETRLWIEEEERTQLEVPLNRLILFKKKRFGKTSLYEYRLQSQ